MVPVSGLAEPIQDKLLSPFSPEGFARRAKAHGIDLGKAAWMAEQPLSYGIDAGRRLDKSGNPDQNLRLEQLAAAGSWKMAAVLVPVLAREPEATVLLTLRTSHLKAHLLLTLVDGQGQDWVSV